MNVVPIRPQSAAERHVQFSEYVEVRHIQTPETTTTIEPSMHAQRLERQMRNAPDVTPQPRSAPGVLANRCKDALHMAALACGALILPSFACLVLGPIGLIVPAALLVLSAVLFLLGGKQTERMEQACAIRRIEAQRFDSCN